MAFHSSPRGIEYDDDGDGDGDGDGDDDVIGVTRVFSSVLRLQSCLPVHILFILYTKMAIWNLYTLCRHLYT